MSAVDQTFAALRAANRKALVPFITAGDPNLEFTARLIQRLAEAGSSIIEIGFPYSDPIADGPVIQASYTRALERKTRVEQIFAMLGTLRGVVQCPLVCMVSFAIIHRIGPERFIEQAQAAGLAGAIVPDLPVEEAAEMSKFCQAADFSLIQLVTPTTPRPRAVQIAATSTGFLYYVSVAGITGERRELPPDLAENVAWLRGQTKLPICIGFGISQPEQVEQLKAVADGVIVGSALVRRVEAALTKPSDAVLADIEHYVLSLKAPLEK